MKAQTLLLWFLCLTLLLPATVRAEFEYTSDNGEITITRYAGTGGAVIIPDTIAGLPVTRVGNYAFALRSDITSVTIGGNVRTIETQGFSDCTGMTSITIPDSVTSIGKFAFSNCDSLTGVTIPDSVTNLSDYSFAFCDRLNSVAIGSGVTAIGYAAFEGPTILSAITVDEHNPAFSSVAGVLFNRSRTTLIHCPRGKTGVYTIPQEVTRIEDEAFTTCHRLTAITIPGSVNSIGYWAFLGCSSLGRIDVPGSVANLPDRVFDRCLALTNVTMSAGLTNVGVQAFAGCSRLAQIQLPEGVVAVGDQAFAGCSRLKTVIFPSSLARLGSRAFSGCIGLPEIALGCNVSSIGDRAFEGCSSLTRVTFEGDAPTAVGSSVFDGSSNVTIYHLLGTEGWNPLFAGRRTDAWVLPNPVILRNSSAGVRNGQFGFTISWAAPKPIVVESSTNLTNPEWTPLSTTSLNGGVAHFTDPQWTNHPARIYRIVVP